MIKTFVWQLIVFFSFEYHLNETHGWNRDLLVFEVAVPNLAQATEFQDAEKLLDYTSYYAMTFKNYFFYFFLYKIQYNNIALKTGNE